MRKVFHCLLLLIPFALASVAFAQIDIKPPQKSSGTAVRSSSRTRRNAGGLYRVVKRASEPTLITRERQVWDAIKRRDMDGFGKFLAEDALEVSSGHVNTKAQSIEELRQLTFNDLVLSEFKVARIDDDAMMVIYRVTANVLYQGKTIPVNERATTIWAMRGGKWLAVFHQGTRIEPEAGQ